MARFDRAFLMKVGVIIPDRGDRPRLFEWCRKLLAAQTWRPRYVMFMNYHPESEEKDITQRYRRGYEQLRNKGLDVICFMESDDWYSPNYIEIMVEEWKRQGRPDLLGMRETIYYHIRLFEYFPMQHEQRSSAMSTLIRADMDFQWPNDNEPYLDSWLWMGPPQSSFKKALWLPEKEICIGIKHGEGMTGGNMHVDRLGHYQAHGKKDFDKKFLRETVDPESFEFYSTFYAEELR